MVSNICSMSAAQSRPKHVAWQLNKLQHISMGLHVKNKEKGLDTGVKQMKTHSWPRDPHYTYPSQFTATVLLAADHIKTTYKTYSAKKYNIKS